MKMTTIMQRLDKANLLKDPSLNLKDPSLNIIICCARTPYNEVTEVMLFRSSNIRVEVI